MWRHSTTGAKQGDKPEPQHEKRTMMGLNFIAGLVSLKLTSKCLRTMAGTSSEQHVAKEL
jgi:hypothetical protein